MKATLEVYYFAYSNMNDDIALTFNLYNSKDELVLSKDLETIEIPEDIIEYGPTENGIMLNGVVNAVMNLEIGSLDYWEE